MKIFWSWQSDVQQATNRYFVRAVLADLAKSLNCVDGTEDSERPPSTEEDEEDDDLGAQDDGRIAIDHDTLGVGGSPRIAEKILEKIEAAAVFVADVTPICKTARGKRVPNPNVMIELGYAMKVLGEERVVLVGNKAEGAELKHLPFDLRHRKAPAFFSLHSDATEEQKAAVATELTTALRDRIVPGLRKAEAVMKEDRRRTQRAPDLAVLLESPSDRPIAISQSPHMGDVKTLDQIKAEAPLLPLPKPKPGIVSAEPVTSSRKGVFDLASLDSLRQPHQWSREETEEYNKRVRHYYTEYERYLAEKLEFGKLVLRSFEVTLYLENSGTAPATRIDADIYLPETILLYDRDDDDHIFPSGPEAPKPPKKEARSSAFAHATATSIPDLINPMRYLPRSTHIYAADRRVHFSTNELKHHHQVSIDTFTISFATEADIASFDAAYVITANEPLDPIEGVIHFEIERQAE
ncbi:MAG: hypothetical protein ACR65T_03845 [Methylocystis sp.]|uniref:hypothetical protein n=1 Tax=Methylocystis sp. TaxID=1911079 RepID=UPI003DA345D0